MNSTSHSTLRVALPLVGLAVAHVALNILCILCGPLKDPDLRSASQFAFLFAETCLLAMFAILAPLSKLSRCLAAIVGYGWILILQGQLFERVEWVFVVVALIMFAMIFGGGTALRRRGGGLRHFGIDQALPRGEPLRFSIIQLFIVTAAIALAAASVHWFRGRFEKNDFLAVAMFSTLFLTSPFLSLWAALGKGNPAVRSMLILMVAASIGLLPFLYSNRPNSMPLWLWPYVFFAQAAIMLASLLVVRSCRYRLGQMNAPAAHAPAPEPPAATLAVPMEGSSVDQLST